MTGTAYIYDDRNVPDRVVVETPYDASFVDSLKQMIPREHRSWDNEEKCWYVGSYWKGPVTTLARRYFDRVEDR